MKLSDLENLASKFGASSVEEFINTYVKTLASGQGGLNYEINTDFDYKKKAPRGPIYRCVEVIDGLIRLVPALDYFNNRWFVSVYIDLTNIQAVFTFDQKKNKFRQEYEETLKTEIAEGKFVNRDAGRIIGANEPEAIRTYPSEPEE